MKRFTSLSLFCLCFPLMAADWSQFLGPNQTGGVDENGLFKDGFSLEVAWKKPLGPGFSSLLVAEGKVYAMHGTEDKDVLTAYNAANGDISWRYEIGPLYDAPDPSVDGPLSTPVLSDGVIYGLAAEGAFFALDAGSGKEIWRRNMVEEHGAVIPRFGISSSPIVYKDTIIVHIGGKDGKAIGAFKKKDGGLKWSIGGDKVAYHSPSLAKVAGTTQLLAPTSDRFMGLSPDSGKVLWETPTKSTVQAIAVDGNHVLLNEDNGFNLYEISKTGAGFNINRTWRTTYLSLDWDMPVAYEGHVYGYKKEFLTCLDGKNGQTVWKTRKAGRGMGILADGHLAIIDREGNFRVVSASPDGFTQKAELKVLDGTGLTEPSYADGTFYVRNYKEIAAVSVKK